MRARGSLGASAIGGWSATMRGLGRAARRCGFRVGASG